LHEVERVHSTEPGHTKERIDCWPCGAGSIRVREEQKVDAADRMKRRMNVPAVGVLAAWVVVAVLAAGCEPPHAARASEAPATAPAAARPTGSPTLASAATARHGKAGSAPFHGTIARIDPAIRGLMIGSSWHPGCPVPIDQLRLLELTYWGFDHRAHHGQLVVNARVAQDVLGVMRKLFSERFPIRRMALADTYGADDDRLMRADVTSAFNCRAVAGDRGVWSQHSYGWAIDINPLENPYLVGGAVLPPAGRGYLDRSLDRPGMIHTGDVVVRAFAAIGWRWGGYWGSSVDYQHFSLTGR
jgi:hypothetical protein